MDGEEEEPGGRLADEVDVEVGGHRRRRRQHELEERLLQQLPLDGEHLLLCVLLIVL